MNNAHQAYKNNNQDPLKAPISAHVNPPVSGTLLQAQEDPRTRETKKAPNVKHIQELMDLGVSLAKLEERWGIQAKSMAQWNDTDRLPPFWTLDAARVIKREMTASKRFLVEVPASQMETFKHLVNLGRMTYKEFDF